MKADDVRKRFQSLPTVDTSAIEEEDVEAPGEYRLWMDIQMEPGLTEWQRAQRFITDMAHRLEDVKAPKQVVVDWIPSEDVRKAMESMNVMGWEVKPATVGRDGKIVAVNVRTPKDLAAAGQVTAKREEYTRELMEALAAAEINDTASFTVDVSTWDAEPMEGAINSAIRSGHRVKVSKREAGTGQPLQITIQRRKRA